MWQIDDILNIYIYGFAYMNKLGNWSVLVHYSASHDDRNIHSVTYCSKLRLWAAEAGDQEVQVPTCPCPLPPTADLHRPNSAVMLPKLVII